MDTEGFLIAALSAALGVILLVQSIAEPRHLPPIALFGG